MKFGCQSIVLDGVLSCVLKALLHLLFEKSENLIVPAQICAVSLIIRQPKRRVGAEENEKQFRAPVAKPGET